MTPIVKVKNHTEKINNTFIHDMTVSLINNKRRRFLKHPIIKVYQTCNFIFFSSSSFKYSFKRTLEYPGFRLKENDKIVKLTQKSMEFSTFVLIRSSFFLQTDILRPTISVFRLLASDRWHLISALCPPLPDLRPLTSDLWLLFPPFYLLIFSPSAFRIFSTSNSPVFWLLSFDFWLLTSGSSLLTSDLWSPSPDLFLLSPCPLILIKRLT